MTYLTINCSHSDSSQSAARVLLHCLKHFHLQKSSVLLPGNAWGEGRLFWSLTHVCHGGQDGGPTKRGRWPSNQRGKGCQRDLILAGQRGWCLLLAEYGIISGWSHGKRVVWCGDWVALESTKIELTDGEQFHDVSLLFMAIQPSPTNYPRKKGSWNASLKSAKGNAWRIQFHVFVFC